MQSKQNESTKICLNCYNSGKFSSNLNIDQFINVKNSVWSEQETLILLENLEKNERNQKIDWEEISKQVGKSKQDCILHFLRLPIEDSLLYNENQKNTKLTERQKDNFFSKLPNPLLSLISFLFDFIDESLSSQTALFALKEITKYKLNSFKTDLSNNIDEEEKEKLFSSLLSQEELQLFSNKSLNYAAQKSHDLIRNEEEHIINHITSIIDSLFKKIDFKLNKINSLEEYVSNEKNKYLEISETLHKHIFK